MLLVTRVHIREAETRLAVFVGPYDSTAKIKRRLDSWEMKPNFMYPTKAQASWRLQCETTLANVDRRGSDGPL
jgi:hypothetical protein